MSSITPQIRRKELELPAHMLTAELLRTACTCPADVPLEPTLVLPELYPVAIVELSRLTVRALRSWLERHRAVQSWDLITCRDRQLRGGIVARYGSGLLFADANDSAEERRFAIAHETAHFLLDHYYPRQDALARLGTSIGPVLDGLRPPTLSERVNALLANSNLYLHTHLLDREQMTTDTYESEAEADAFACEILAPRAALESRFPHLAYNETMISQVCAVLVDEYALPPRQALPYAQRLAANNDHNIPLLNRLRFV